MGDDKKKEKKDQLDSSLDDDEREAVWKIKVGPIDGHDS